MCTADPRRSSQDGNCKVVLSVRHSQGFPSRFIGTGPNVPNKPQLFYLCSGILAKPPDARAISVSEPAAGAAFGDSVSRGRERIGMPEMGHEQPMSCV